MHDEILDEPTVPLEEQDDPQPAKRNSGRTGPTSSAGRARSSQNAFKHGACAQALILPGESEEAWLILLDRWCITYKPEDDSLQYDFVLKTAQAEWHRIRNQRYYDGFLANNQGISPFNWTPEQVKMHDLLLRYKTAADRAFQREYRLLEQHCKAHKPAAPAEEPELIKSPTLYFVGRDPKSPTGYTTMESALDKPTLRYPSPPEHLPPPQTAKGADAHRQPDSDTVLSSANSETIPRV